MPKKTGALEKRLCAQFNPPAQRDQKNQGLYTILRETELNSRKTARKGIQRITAEIRITKKKSVESRARTATLLNFC